jgi:hypothetical protein
MRAHASKAVSLCGSGSSPVPEDVQNQKQHLVGSFRLKPR